MLGILGANQVTEVLSNKQVQELIQRLIADEAKDHAMSPNLLIGGIITLLVVAGIITILMIVKNWRRPPVD